MNKKKYPWEKDIVSVSRTGTSDYGTGGTPSNAKPNYSGTRDHSVVKPTTPQKSIADLIASMGYTGDNKTTSAEYYTKANTPFSFDLNGNALYNQYKDHYTKQAEMAREDAIGRAAALTGGYGNSYAMNAGQQMYNARMDELNNVIPELYNMAYNQWNNERQHNLDMADRYAQMDAQEYSKALQLAQMLNQSNQTLNQSNAEENGNDKIPQNILKEVSQIPDSATRMRVLAGYVLAGYMTEEEADDLYDAYSTTPYADAFGKNIGEWSIVDTGDGMNLWGIDNDVTVKLPNGEEMTLATLRDKLIAEGMDKSEANDIIKEITEKLKK